MKKFQKVTGIEVEMIPESDEYNPNCTVKITSWFGSSGRRFKTGKPDEVKEFITYLKVAPNFYCLYGTETGR